MGIFSSTFFQANSDAEIVRQFTTTDNNLTATEHLTVTTTTGNNFRFSADLGERRMKITAVYDREGTILGAVIDDERYDGPRPVPIDGMQVGKFEVPTSVRSFALDEICTTFRVNSKIPGRS